MALRIYTAVINVTTEVVDEPITGGSIEVPTRVKVREAVFSAPASLIEVPTKVSLREVEMPMKATASIEVPTRVKVRGERLIT